MGRVTKFSNSDNFKGHELIRKIGTFFASLKFPKRRVAAEKEKAEFIARSIFQEWLVQVLFRTREIRNDPGM